jgi:hypothetical protein
MKCERNTNLGDGECNDPTGRMYKWMDYLIMSHDYLGLCNGFYL